MVGIFDKLEVRETDSEGNGDGVLGFREVYGSTKSNWFPFHLYKKTLASSK
jgi:hypothetical protein